MRPDGVEIAVSTTTRRLTIAVSGSRTIQSADLVYRLLDERAIHYLSSGYELHWHFGDAPGVDTLAFGWARERAMSPRTVFCASLEIWMGWQKGDIGIAGQWGVQEGETFVPSADWAKMGRQAGAIRNGAMLRGEGCPVVGCKGADVLFAIWDGRSPGTLNARMQARGLNVACQTYTVTREEAGWVDELAAGADVCRLTPVRH